MDGLRHFHRLSDIDTVIVGVDLSEESKELVREGQWLSKALGAELVLINVRPLDRYIETVFATQTFWDEDVEQTIREIRKFYDLRPGDIKIEVRFGDPATEIEALSETYPNPLVFIGHSKKKSWEKLLSGSASRDLAAESRTHILIY